MGLMNRTKEGMLNLELNFLKVDLCFAGGFCLYLVVTNVTIGASYLLRMFYLRFYCVSLENICPVLTQYFYFSRPLCYTYCNEILMFSSGVSFARNHKYWVAASVLSRGLARRVRNL